MVKKFLGQKNIGSKKFWVIKIFEIKKCLIRNFFRLKKTGRVNPGWRIYVPPPQKKIVGLKLYWIVVSLAW